MASNPNVRRFYESVLEAAAEDGSLYASLLSVEGRPVAFEFNLLSERTLHNFKLGYRKDAGEWSPGLVLKAFTLRRFAEGFASDTVGVEYDFMGTTEPYKLSWTETVRSHERIVASRPTARARLQHAWHYRLKPILRTHAPWIAPLARLLRRGTWSA